MQIGNFYEQTVIFKVITNKKMFV